jgi:hypothetical protein
VFTFIVYHKLSVVEVVLDLMRAIWGKALNFRIIFLRKHIILMRFFIFVLVFFFVLVKLVTLKNTIEDVGSGFF